MLHLLHMLDFIHYTPIMLSIPDDVLKGCPRIRFLTLWTSYHGACEGTSESPVRHLSIASVSGRVLKDVILDANLCV